MSACHNLHRHMTSAPAFLRRSAPAQGGRRRQASHSPSQTSRRDASPMVASSGSMRSPFQQSMHLKGDARQADAPSNQVWHAQPYRAVAVSKAQMHVLQ